MQLKAIERTRVLISLFLLLPFCISSVFADDIRAGAAQVKITPPTGIPMAGYYSRREAQSIHNDLYAKALVFEKNGSKAAIVSCDLINVPARLVASVRNLVEQATDIKPEHIMVGATHNHYGPVIFSEFKQRHLPEGKSGKILTAYNEKLPALIAESVIQANKQLEVVKLSYGSGHEESIAFNRRFYMKDGSVGWNPGKLNPAILKPAGPIDPEVDVLYVESLEGNPVATYVDYAIHLDISGEPEITADMPHTLYNILGKVKGEEMVTLYGQGCCGNINHFDVNWEDPQQSHDEARRIGTILAGEVIKTYAKLSDLEPDQVEVRQAFVDLPLPVFSKDEIRDAYAMVERYRNKESDLPFLDLVKAMKITDVDQRKGEPVKAEIQVIVLNDEFAFISLPGEIFVELGLYLKERSPFKNTIIIELANGSLDYFPDMKACWEGNYEPTSSRFAPGTGELLIEQALVLLHEIKGEIGN